MFKMVVENWFLIVIALCFLIIAVLSIIGFLKTPKKAQIEKVQEWMLQAVIECEKKLGSKTGAAKLSLCFDMFVSRFPAVASVISFETFSKLVDASLDKMKNMLESNKNLQDYVYGVENN